MDLIILFLLNFSHYLEILHDNTQEWHRIWANDIYMAIRQADVFFIAFIPRAAWHSCWCTECPVLHWHQCCPSRLLKSKIAWCLMLLQIIINWRYMYIDRTFKSAYNNQSRFCCIVMQFEIMTIYLANSSITYPRRMKQSEGVILF